jgi:type IV pilus assembly protein PilC
MPYFTWQGITILGAIKKGRSFAQTPDELRTVLYARDIALLSCKQARKAWWLPAIGSRRVLHFFKQLTSLLNSGVLLPEALHIISRQIDHEKMQEIAHALAESVHAGSSLHHALAQYPTLFSPLMVHSVHIGQETGKLAHACQALCSHIEMHHTFKRSVRAAVMMPAITGLFFLIIAAIIIVGIIPHFAAIFSSMQQELPYLTRMLIHISDTVRSFAILIPLGLLGLIALILYHMRRSAHGKKLLDTAIAHMPLVGPIMMDGARAHLLHSAATLIGSGVSVPVALRIATGSIPNALLHEYALYLEYAVKSGNSLHQAMAQHPEQWFDQQVVAMVAVGQESVSLSKALMHAAIYYQKRVEDALYRYATILQPLLIIVLGLAIALFIFAVYLPIFNMANTVY